MKRFASRLIILMMCLLLIVPLGGCSTSGDASGVASEQSYSYVGSVNSDVYHNPSCKWAMKIHSENEIWFTDAEDARSSGYRPCKVCKP